MSNYEYIVVPAPNLHSFERRLDKFWAGQDAKYEYHTKAPDMMIEDEYDDDEDVDVNDDEM